ncbi:thyrotropin-releasing hormone receptor [Lingula anatina]|uniref:Thyrotropin-releasing hormone receptor n=1 Tax=Lingula anatina TaxID=7574 RepID=A0A1S3J1V4_LINAN|nr:thyrotropin-releasing hormone receptor [Lingula anatina]|eukprot:XP_013404405.1 thyrotropin-releasing hormone receptor [Lingula anatina]
MCVMMVFQEPRRSVLGATAETSVPNETENSFRLFENSTLMNLPGDVGNYTSIFTESIHSEGRLSDASTSGDEPFPHAAAYILTMPAEPESTMSSVFTANTSLVTKNNGADSPEVDSGIYGIIFQIIVLYIPPFILVGGITGNILAFIVTFKKRHKHITAYFFISVMAILDTVMLLFFQSTYWLFFNFFSDSNTDALCKGMTLCEKIVADCSIFTTLVMTTDRFVAIKYPLKAKTFCTVSRSWKVLLTGAILIVCKNLHLAWTVRLHNGQLCLFLPKNNEALLTAWPWFDIIVTFLLPFMMLTSLNTVIIRTVLKANKTQKRLVSFSLIKKMDTLQVPGQPATPHHSNPQKSHERQRLQVTIMLVSVSVLFVLMTSPYKILLLFDLFIGQNSEVVSSAWYVLLTHAFQHLYYTNSAVNFYLYCLSGRIFRRHLRHVCGCTSKKKKRSDREIDSNTNSMMTSFNTRSELAINNNTLNGQLAVTVKVQTDKDKPRRQSCIAAFGRRV